MRGVVTLAAVFALPEDTPQRRSWSWSPSSSPPARLLLQGLHAALAGPRLGVHGPTRARTRSRRRPSCRRRSAPGCATSTSAPTRSTPRLIDALRPRAEKRDNIVWERLGQGRDGAQETPSETYRRVRLQMLGAERAEVLRIRDAGDGDHEVLTR